jgi:prolyl 4-hydroxylase
LIRARTETPPLLPEYEAPEYLRKKCRDMQAAAPSLGLGFKKARLPAHLHQRLMDHFRANLERFRSEAPVDEIRTAARQTIPALLFDDQAFNLQLAEDLRPLHEEWAGMPLVLSHCYGIRCYQRGTFLYNHVDRRPHFVSSTICVDHALDSPWPLSIEDEAGRVSQISTEPGEFILYEGLRLAHGRPYPLDGEFYAGIFVHYLPASERAPKGMG